jgi:hypothetical protein
MKPTLLNPSDAHQSEDMHLDWGGGTNAADLDWWHKCRDIVLVTQMQLHWAGCRNADGLGWWQICGWNGQVQKCS